MEYRTLEIKFMAAKDLKKLYIFSKMKVYAVISVYSGAGNGNQSAQTCVDPKGHNDPSWSKLSIKFAVDDAAARLDRVTLKINLHCGFNGNDVGYVEIPIKRLLDSPATGKQLVTYPVVRVTTSGLVNWGKLTICYQFYPPTDVLLLPPPCDPPRNLPLPPPCNPLPPPFDKLSLDLTAEALAEALAPMVMDKILQIKPLDRLQTG